MAHYQIRHNGTPKMLFRCRPSPASISPYWAKLHQFGWLCSSPFSGRSRTQGTESSPILLTEITVAKLAHACKASLDFFLVSFTCTCRFSLSEVIYLQDFSPYIALRRRDISNIIQPCHSKLSCKTHAAKTLSREHAWMKTSQTLLLTLQQKLSWSPVIYGASTVYISLTEAHRDHMPPWQLAERDLN